MAIDAATIAALEKIFGPQPTTPERPKDTVLDYNRGNTGSSGTYSTVIPKPEAALSKDNIDNTVSDIQNIGGPADEFYKRYGEFIAGGGVPYSHVNEDLVKRDAAQNLNGIGYAGTLRRSRLADMLNNRYYLQYGDIGARGAGSQGTGNASAGIQMPTRYQMPIVTEEMRQMQQMRQDQAQRNQRQIGRQQDVMDQGQKLNYALQLEYLRQKGALSDEMIRQMISAPFTEKMRRSGESFSQFLTRLVVPQAQANDIMTIYRNNPDMAGILVPIIGHLYAPGFVPPGMMDLFNSQMAGPMWRRLANGGQLDMDYMTEQLQAFFKQFETFKNNMAGSGSTTGGTP